MIEIRTPCRLHFGLLALDHGGARQYGGVGLMIQRPDIAIRVTPSEALSATGPMSDKALMFARRFIERADALVDPVAIEMLRAPRAHTGLGTGTQLGMAVAHAMAMVIGRDDLTAPQLARRVGRGERSAIGTHGFEHGGLIVEGGKTDADAVSPMLVRHACPESWRFVLISPSCLTGVADDRERHAFAQLPPIPPSTTAQMCRLVLLGLVPAMLERDLGGFGEALFELQQHVGRSFAAAQGGIYADPLLERIVTWVRGRGVAGIGQSSWGPTLYAVVAGDYDASSLAGDVARQFDLSPDEVVMTRPDNHGATVRRHEPSPTSREG